MTDPAFCGCGEADAPEAPGAVFNRPALPQIAWRIETFAGFRAAALRDLTAALPGLTTREGDDHAITLIELWAAMADVLTFAQERIANEGYLRTAIHRDSVRRLVRLLDYRPFAGLAAETRLAFALDPGATLTLKPGTRAMSVPGQDELPQIFETLEQVEGDARLNRLQVRGVPIPHDPFAAGVARATFLATPDRIAASDPLLFFWAGVAEEKTLSRIAPAAAAREVAWSPPNQRALPQAAIAAKVERAFRLFAHNAPASRMEFDPGAKSGTSWTRIPGWVTRNDSMAIPGGAAPLPLDGRIEALKPGAAVVADIGSGTAPIRLATVTAVTEATETFGALTDKVTRIALARQFAGQPALEYLAGGTTRLVARLATGQGVLLLPGTAGAAEPLPLPDRDGAPVPLTGDIVTAGTAGRLDMLARGEGTALWHLRGVTGLGLGAWTRLDGGLKGDAVAVAPAADRLDILVRGWDDAVWLRRGTGAGAAVAWGPWISLGGRATGPVAAASVPVLGGVVCAVVRGPDFQGFANLFNTAAATGWRPLPPLALGAEITVQAIGAFFAVIARGADDGALHLTIGGAAGWGPWVDIPGEEKVAGRAALALSAAGLLIAARGENGELLGAAWSLSGAATGWTELGGPIAGDPVLATQGARTAMAARFADGTLRLREADAGAWGAWRLMAEGIGAIADRRAVRLWQVAQPFVVPRRFDYPRNLSGARVTATIAELDAIAAKRGIALTDGRTTHVATVAGATPIAAYPGGEPELLAIDFSPPLPNALDGAATFMLGNLARAGQGETQREEILGTGNAAIPFQRFALKRAPVTRRAAAGALRGLPDITILVDGEAWTLVETLHGRGPAERICVLEEGEDGTTIVQFGDGITGARLPSGPGNVRALYRIGLGLAGHVRAGQLSVLLTRPPGLLDVTNPLPGSGAADPEDADQARRNAPGRVRTFGRAISLRDLEALAIETGLATEARADWVWSGIERVVHLTIAAPGGPTPDSLSTLAGVLGAARDRTQRLLLGAVRRVAIRIAGTIVVDPAFVRDAVLDAARAAAMALLGAERRGIAMPVHRSEVIATLQSVRGVLGVDLDALAFRGDAGWTAAQRRARDLAPGILQDHLRLFPARPLASTLGDPLVKASPGEVLPRILGAEQAFADAADIHLLASGGLA